MGATISRTCHGCNDPTILVAVSGGGVPLARLPLTGVPLGGVPLPGLPLRAVPLACGVPVALFGFRGLMPQESGLFHAASRHDFGFAVDSFEDLESVIKLGPEEWNRKREYVLQFYRASSGEELIERIQPVHVRA